MIASPDLAPIDQKASTALAGTHNAENAAAAALALHALGLDDQLINHGISSFTTYHIASSGLPAVVRFNLSMTQKQQTALLQLKP